MALHLNLLHEQIAETRQRQRDPLKLGIMLIGTIGALMLAFYMWKAYETLAIKNRLSVVQSEWAKVEPKVTAAQKRSKELTTIISTTKALDTFMESRFYWAPFLEKVSRCVAPNAQLLSMQGSVDEEQKVVVSLEGTAAGREPRAAAEEFRQLLLEQLSTSYQNVKVEFKALEDLDTLINVAGTNMPVARYTLGVTFTTRPSADAPAPAAPAPAAAAATSETAP